MINRRPKTIRLLLRLLLIVLLFCLLVPNLVQGLTHVSPCAGWIRYLVTTKCVDGQGLYLYTAYRYCPYCACDAHHPGQLIACTVYDLYAHKTIRHWGPW
jgi:hypothetical protein